MANANATVEGVEFFVPGGVNERILPELIPKEDFNFLMGMIPKQLGELISAPGKTLLTRELIGQTILQIVPFGNYLLVQTNTNLIRFSNFELFGGIDSTNNLTPDTYPTTSDEEELMAQIILRYSVPANSGGANLTTGLWTPVPFNTEVRDTGGNCVLAANQFTLTSGAYPKNCRIKAWCTVRGNTTATPTPANARLGLFIPAVSTLTPILYGTNARIVNPTAASRSGNVSLIEDYFVLAAATVYDLRMYVDAANCSMGDPINAGGLAEIYAAAEILFEP